MAQDEAGFDRAVPSVSLELEGRVARVARVVADAAVAAERDRTRPDPARADGEARVAPLPHRSHVGELCPGDQQARRRVPHPARLEPLELLGQVESERVARDDRVDPFAALQQIRGQHPLSVELERDAEVGQRFARDSQAGGGAVTAVAVEHGRAGVQRFEQVEAGDAASRPRPQLAVERDQNRGTVVVLGDPRGDDPHHPRVPVVARQHVGASRSELAHLRLGLPQDPLLDRAALGVDHVELGRDLAGALRIVGQQQLEAHVGPAQPAGRVDPRRQPEAERPGVDRARIGAADADQRSQAGLGRVRERRQTLSDEPPVLVDQWHEVGDRRERDQLDVLVRGARAQRLRQLVCDPRPAETVERVRSRRQDARSGSPAAGHRGAAHGGR